MCSLDRMRYLIHENARPSRATNSRHLNVSAMLTLMRIDFLKMQALGNDFLVFDAPASDTPMNAALARISDRRTGVGFDQALMIAAPQRTSSRAAYRVFNADGGEVEQCGNGARCVAALVYARKPNLGREFSLDSAAGPVQARVLADGSVAVNMGIPNFNPSALPMQASEEAAQYSLDITTDGAEGDAHGGAHGGAHGSAHGSADARPGARLGLGSSDSPEQVLIGAVSIGNPHAVLQVPDVDVARVQHLGLLIERHARFPKRVNVGFMQIVDRTRIRLRVFERGVGETLACGTGACAAVALARRWGLVNDIVEVDLRGGRAMVTSTPGTNALWLTGPAITVYSGSIDI